MLITEILAQPPVIPLITLYKMEDARPVAKALMEGGLTSLEITLRTPVALSCVGIIREAFPQLTVGVGNVLQQEQLHAAKGAGAQFASSPGFALELLQLASVLDLPYLPGVMTVSEMMQARELNVSLLKFFPAEAAGGDNFLRIMQGVFSDLMFVASGGIHAQNIQHYLT
ncbi:MAG TPA: bifunctional 4-hydroxy-2-oxoglutarate aldolase/2-dehydro-3-deoxy-phosphogluconate aldolase, partial [Gammaproteobacteria bacterium]|nr:bifunctional 4-hydroxy-2-oxoglutarate aldolase/2-dehydro-3-deoxy-phosphogluconate aldolase [Gammaproteobacteria bacterium]